MLEISKLRTYYFTDDGVVKAVDGVDLSVGDGEFFGIAGESGCGKSTLGFSILRLIEEPGKIVGGKILMDGTDVLSLDEKGLTKFRGAEISMIFQDPFTSLNPVLTIGDQISEALKLHKGLNAKEAEAAGTELLSSVKIKDAADVYKKYPHQLSGGMRQRVMIAIAVSCGSKLLIADEPTTALDVTSQARIMELLKELQEKRGLSVILISHNRRLIRKYCKNAALMENGRIVRSGRSEDVLADDLQTDA